MQIWMNPEIVQYVGHLKNTWSSMGLEAELQNSCCHGQQAENKLDPMFAEVKVLGTFSGYGSHFSEEDEEGWEEKNNLQEKILQVNIFSYLRMVLMGGVKLLNYHQCHLQVHSRGRRDEKWMYREWGS